MLEIFQYNFMIKAFLVGMLIALIVPCIGLVVVLRRLSMIGDTLSHSSLAGVAGGLAFGINPILGATIISIFSAFGIEKIRKSFPRYAEIALAIIMSTGIGLAGILSGFVKNTSGFHSFLFGSIVAISSIELISTIILSIVVFASVIILYRELFYITFDEVSARLSGIPVKAINSVFTLLTAVTISISARTVGTLVISSLMVLPVACALQLAKSYKQTFIYSIIFAELFTITGLFISYYANFKPGATIVMTGVICLLTILFYKGINKTLIIKKPVKG